MRLPVYQNMMCFFSSAIPALVYQPAAVSLNILGNLSEIADVSCTSIVLKQFCKICLCNFAFVKGCVLETFW